MSWIKIEFVENSEDFFSPGNESFMKHVSKFKFRRALPRLFFCLVAASASASIYESSGWGEPEPRVAVPYALGAVIHIEVLK